MRGSRMLIWGSFIVFLLAFAGAVLYRPYAVDWWRHSQSNQAQNTLGQLEIGERTLIVAPHPDDETLGGGGVIEKAVAAGKQVKVVIMTSGDGYERAVIENFGVLKPSANDYRRLGETRHLETLAAMQHFGVKAENVIFLGYPDGGVNGMWESDWDYDKLHRGLNGADRSPYPFAYEPNASYCGANVVKNLISVIREFQPTDIVYPDPNDQHHDHWATSAFVKYVLTEQKYKTNEWTYLVHRGDYPVPWKYEPDSPLHPPFVLSGLDTHWIALPMDEREERIKREAIQKYGTQTKVMNRFLEAFIRTNELLGTYNDPVLPVEQGNLRLDGTAKLPYTVFLDAFSDTIKRELEGNADLTAVAAVLDRQGLHIGIETREPIADNLMYNIRLRLFHSGQVGRLDLTVHRSRVTGVRYASNSLEMPDSTRLRIQGRQLWVTLPASVLDGISGIMLCADSFKNRERIDKTAWRLIRVAQSRS